MTTEEREIHVCGKVLKNEFTEHTKIGGPNSRKASHPVPTAKEIEKELKQRLNKG